ncbi:TIR domain-containing protein [Bradyrhizobium sp. CB82]|uniref:TIR domain-containing protein n=1 Tax=Bradyrhizobium sp. CB82 TaxID=3039159 RepID=UPI0024B1FCF2|nr:TIR domain-containing protein [Bradyrhizobium sp. CB82]WFU39007.1 TIR domain-containing protein [Bradyrhizobium sp. CB82]
MAYRNGSYIAFHAGGSTDPTASDIKYYRMLKAWHEHDDIDFQFINSHDKVAGVRDTSKKETLRRSLVERLNNSKNMVLIIGPTTRLDTDWVPFEIAYAVDQCKIPIIATYTGYEWITQPQELRPLWPPALASRIDNGTLRAIHIPFKQGAIDDAIKQFSHENLPATALNYYTVEAHRSFGIDIR